jgi:hypothetical protein
MKPKPGYFPDELDYTPICVGYFPGVEPSGLLLLTGLAQMGKENDFPQVAVAG